MATDDDDAATLRERVRELEATVAQQQDTIEQLMPSRRAILAGGAGLVGGAALTGQASAQSAAGQVGTSSEPVDVEAASVNADSVNVDDLSTETFAFSDPTGVINNEAEAYIAELGFGNNEGWTSYLQLDHNGSDDGAFYGFFRVLFESIVGDTSISESGTHITVNNDSDFGTTGSTTSISTHLRFKVDDADATIAYIQVDRDQQFLHGLFRGEYIGRSGVSTTALDPI